MKITGGSIVRLEYELRVKGGDVIESSARSGPIQYVHGQGKLLPALEKRLEGLSAGQSLEGTIPAAEATPPEESLPSRAISRSEFPKDAAFEKGALYEAHTANGATINLRILSADDKQVHVRLLPPLAGKELSFKVKILAIEDPVKGVQEIVLKRPPPLPAEALKHKIDLEPDEG